MSGEVYIIDSFQNSSLCTLQANILDNFQFEAEFIISNKFRR